MQLADMLPEGKIVMRVTWKTKNYKGFFEIRSVVKGESLCYNEENDDACFSVIIVTEKFRQIGYIKEKRRIGYAEAI